MTINEPLHFFPGHSVGETDDVVLALDHKHLASNRSSKNKLEFLIPNSSFVILNCVLHTLGLDGFVFSGSGHGVLAKDVFCAYLWWFGGSRHNAPVGISSGFPDTVSGKLSGKR